MNYFYLPHLSTSDLSAIAAGGDYDAVIAAAKIIPEDTRFPLGGVWICSGTANMRSASWGGPNGTGGFAPLMNTPGVNARATAQMVFRAITRDHPDLPFGALHGRIVRSDFDTSKHLRDCPTIKLEGRSIAIMGFGAIAQEVVRLAETFGMEVNVYARERHRRWIESLGYRYAAKPECAASGAEFLTLHIGLGLIDTSDNRHANQGFLDRKLLSSLAGNAMVINFDRGELAEPDDLSDWLGSDPR